MLQNSPYVAASADHVSLLILLGTLGAKILLRMELLCDLLRLCYLLPICPQNKATVFLSVPLGFDLGEAAPALEPHPYPFGSSRF
jgi:hypothetical protein